MVRPSFFGLEELPLLSMTFDLAAGVDLDSVEFKIAAWVGLSWDQGNKICETGGFAF